MEYFVGAFKKYADFSGRARRKEYWMFILFYIIIYLLLTIVDLFLGSIIISSIFGLVVLIPSISLCARRLHDTGRTGWWQLIAIIPIIGWIILLFFVVQDSHDENKYGKNPKQV